MVTTPSNWNFDSFRTPVGWCTLAVASNKLSQLRFHKSTFEGSRETKPFRDGVMAYFEGERMPDFPLDLSWASRFQREIYRVVRRIPHGKVLTYGEVAAKAGFSGSARAVGGAMGKNQICLAIP